MAEQGPELVVVRGIEEGAGQAQRVSEAEVQSVTAEALGFLGEEAEIELQVVPHDDSRLKVVDEDRQLRRHDVVAGRDRVAAPVKPDALLVYRGDLADAPAAVRTQGSGFQIEEDQRGGAEGTVRPGAHRLNESRGFVDWL